MLIEDETLELLQRRLRLCARVGLLPWTLSRSQRRLRTNSSARFLWKVKLNQLVLGCTIVACTLLVLVSFTRLRGQVPDSYWLGLTLFLILLLSIMYAQNILIRNRFGMAVTINSVISLVDSFDRCYGLVPPEEIVADKQCGVNLRRALTVFHLVIKHIVKPVCFILPFIYFKSHVLVILQLNEQLENMFGTRIPYYITLSHVLILFPWAFTVSFMCACFFEGFVAITFAMAWYMHHVLANKINLSEAFLGGSTRETRRLLRHPENAVPVYQSLRLAICGFTKFFADFICFGEFAALALWSFVLYFVAGSGGPILERLYLLVILLIGGTYSTFMFHMFGNVNTLSGELLDSWRRDYGRRKASTGFDQFVGAGWLVERRI